MSKPQTEEENLPPSYNSIHQNGQIFSETLDKEAFSNPLLLHPKKVDGGDSCNHNGSSSASTKLPLSSASTSRNSLELSTELEASNPLRSAHPDFLVKNSQIVPSVAVKLFVNRIPKWMCSEKLKDVFAAYGTVLECNVLKDIDGHKGCAFIKYSSISDAHAAILRLHGKMVLNEEAGPVQIKYADGEIERLGLSADVQPGGESVKVFVGCLSKSCSEEELFSLFSRFGRVDEVFVIRDNKKQPKCSAFITFPKMAMALAAIRSLDKQYTLPTGRRPIEVRLAESKSSKQKLFRLQSNPLSGFVAENLGSYGSKSHETYRPSSSKFPIEATPALYTNSNAALPTSRCAYSTRSSNYAPRSSYGQCSSPICADTRDMPNYPSLTSLHSTHQFENAYGNYFKYLLPEFCPIYFKSRPHSSQCGNSYLNPNDYLDSSQNQKLMASALSPADELSEKMYGRPKCVEASSTGHLNSQHMLWNPSILHPRMVYNGVNNFDGFNHPGDVYRESL